MALKINDFPYAKSYNLSLTDLGAKSNSVKIKKDRTVADGAKYLEAFYYVKGLGSTVTISPAFLQAVYALDYTTAHGWLKEFDLYFKNLE